MNLSLGSIKIMKHDPGRNCLVLTLYLPPWFLKTKKDPSHRESIAEKKLSEITSSNEVLPGAEMFVEGPPVTQRLVALDISMPLDIGLFENRVPSIIINLDRVSMFITSFPFFSCHIYVAMILGPQSRQTQPISETLTSSP